MKAKDLDKIFDEGGVDITAYLDLSQAFRPGHEQKRVNVDFPVWMIDRLDRESSRLDVPRQSLINVWIAERLGTPNAKSKRSKRSSPSPQPPATSRRR
tara:strand:- start:107 stop:400 length:294 start_codon:yes stop_codon:yes gene_type:complete